MKKVIITMVIIDVLACIFFAGVHMGDSVKGVIKDIPIIGSKTDETKEDYKILESMKIDEDGEILYLKGDGTYCKFNGLTELRDYLNEHTDMCWFAEKDEGLGGVNKAGVAVVAEIDDGKFEIEIYE